jgi:hypothetical protein
MSWRTNSADRARLLVWFAGHMVPSGDRGEWAAEWNAELCHVCQAHACDPVRFSLGAFHDAFWLGSDHVRSRALAVFPSGSASRCLLSLAILAMGGLLLCISLPGVRRALSAAPYRNPADLVVISSDGYAGALAPSIPVSDYREWKIVAHRLFSQIAYYQPAVRTVRLDPRRQVTLSVALASENLLRVLDFSRQDGGHPIPGERQLILSQSAWARRFGSAPDLLGRSVLIAGKPAVIAGILPDRQWRLPGGVNALLTENAREFAALPQTTRGFVVARLRGSRLPANREAWLPMFEIRNGIALNFVCIPFASLFPQPFSVFLLSLLMACISLPATTPLRLGDYPEHHGRLPGTVGARRWVFLLVKLLLLLLVVSSWSAAVAYGFASADSSTSLYIQLCTAFPALLIAFRWMLHDQRKRCPVCLRLLSDPARVGQPSCNFLAWCGTELICRSGHGLLHIPELPTSWFATQRWLCLDASWASLFPPGCGSP